uniref:DUF5824 domain-containing protein n=1 Tax=viral metagenome TaxID=1070528 RepID=A0A6C0I8K5_9ZZZZ
MKTRSITLRYLPKRLSRKDKKTQLKMIRKSRKMYKKGVYFTRKPVKSFTTKTSKHILVARKMYNIENIGANEELAKKSGCSLVALKKIVSKGEGAYFSSGSRPNQTAQSWGNARLASALTAGKAGAVDYNILHDGCKVGSKGYKMAELAKRRYGHGQRKAAKASI